MNFLHDDIVHALQNTIDSFLNSATDRRGYVLERRFTEFSEITQYDGHYTRFKVIQDHRLSYQWNTHIRPVSKLWLIIGQIFASERRVPHFNALAKGDPLPISP